MYLTLPLEMVQAYWYLELVLLLVRRPPGRTITTCCAYSARKVDWFRPAKQVGIQYKCNKISGLAMSSRSHHIAFEDMVHNFMSLQPGSVDQKLKSKFQPRVHFPATRLSLAFFASPLRFHVIVSHDDVSTRQRRQKFATTKRWVLRVATILLIW